MLHTGGQMSCSWPIKGAIVQPSDSAPGLSQNTWGAGRITLTMIRPKLTAEGRLWVNTLTPDEADSIEYTLNLIGEDNFIKNWREHRDMVQKMRDF
jgi:hypothetical protein